MTKTLSIRLLGCGAMLLAPLLVGADEPRCLPGELSAEAVLNGAYPFPESPATDAKVDESGLARERLSPPPPPGVHPRILLSPADLPGLRERLRTTEAGRAMLATLRERTHGSILKDSTWEHDLFTRLAAADLAGARAILDKPPAPSTKPGHYQPYILYLLTLEAFDALLSDDAARGAKVGAAVAGYAKLAEPLLAARLASPLADDVWRIKVQGPVTGAWGSDQGMRDLMGYHLMGYAYDFSYNFMTDAQRAQVRGVIAHATAGRLWMGARLPHHFRNWNWIAVGLGQPLLSLAIEGEEGYDPRVYKLGVQIARDYLSYGISAKGSSTEAVGYTQFGFVWGAPFIVAALRRGDNVLCLNHHRAMLDWYLQSMEPFGGAWKSHGDGGDGGPDIHTLMMWRYFFPGDARADVLWANYVKSMSGKPYAGNFHVIETLLWATDGKPAGDVSGKGLMLPCDWFDPARGSLILRSAWQTNAAVVQLECRVDSVGASHEHADRGNFTFSALGRSWAKENFRSIESRHHNVVLVDGMGQGFWPGPGKWLGNEDAGWSATAACDAKEAYDWWWPKQIISEDPGSFVRFKAARWEDFQKSALSFRRDYGAEKVERDSRPGVVSHWQGFMAGDPRMWDEDSWPVRLAHNPVQKAFRTVIFVRDPQPYLVVVDDIRKDDREHLYEWLMQTGPNTEAVTVKDNELVLCDASVPHDAEGLPKPEKGDRCLLVRVLEQAEPDRPHDTQARPSLRLETYERKDTLGKDGRSFGMDKRVVAGCRAVEPRFKVLLFPFRQGEALPKTEWSPDGRHLVLAARGIRDEFEFSVQEDGRTRVVAKRNNEK